MVDLFDVFDFSQPITTPPPCCPPTDPVKSPNSMVDTASNIVLASLNQLVDSASDTVNLYRGGGDAKQPHLGYDSSRLENTYTGQQNQQQNYGSSGSVIYPLNYQYPTGQQGMKQKSVVSNSKNYQYYLEMNNKKPIYSMATSAGNPLAAAVRDRMTSVGDNTKVMDDEYLSSIRDITKGNQIYSTNNPEMDNLSPSMLWKNDSMVTVNRIIPITTKIDTGTNREGILFYFLEDWCSKIATQHFSSS